MPLFLGQLIYTSFTKVGFKLIATPQIPVNVQQAFIEEIVNQRWNAYSPPKVGYRAAYIYQVSLDATLFGWLYNDGEDDLGRSHVPYFHSYYLPEFLDGILLENIFNCLQRGPVELLERYNMPSGLAPIAAPDLWNYQPARIGVEIAFNVRDRCQTEVQENKLINLFIPGEPENIVSGLTVKNAQQKSLPSPSFVGEEAKEYKDISPSAPALQPLNLNIDNGKTVPLSSTRTKKFNVANLGTATNQIHSDRTNAISTEETIQNPTAKKALLIGINENNFDFNGFANAQKDIEAMQKVLQDPEIANFSEVTTLLNPNKQEMEEAIETLCSNCETDDLVLLYFSGTGIKDDNNKLYLTTSGTRKNAQNKLVKSSAVLATFVQDVMNSAPSRHQIVILECAWLSETTTEGLLNENSISLEVKNQLGGDRRVIITSSNLIGYSFEQYESDISAYTRYLLEGMKTGAAALDNDTVVSIKKLHEYAVKKIQQAIPARQPGIYGLENYQHLILAKVPVDEAKRKYRHEVENYVKDGEITIISRSILGVMREQLGLLPEDASAIETEVLEPFREYQTKLQLYAQEFVKLIYSRDTITDDSRQQLKYLQVILGIRTQDVAKIETQCLERIKASSHADNCVIVSDLNEGQIGNLKKVKFQTGFTKTNQNLKLNNKSIFQKIRIAILLALGSIYIFFQWQDYQYIKTIENYVKEKKYKECLALTPLIGQISVYYLLAQKLQNTCQIAGNTKTIWSVAFTPNGNTFATASTNNKIKLWDAKTEKELQTLPGHSGAIWSIAISPDGETLASGSGDQTIKLWNIATGELIRIITGHKNKVRSVAISPDGNTIASGSYDQTIKLWDIKTGKLINTLSGHLKEVNAVAISPDGNTIASGSYDQTIRLWDIKTGKLINTLSGHSGKITSIAISPDGQTIASGSYDRTIKLWNLYTGGLIRTLSGHSNWVNAIAISPDGQLLASGAEDHLVMIWDLNTGKLLRTISEHAHDVYSVSISPDSGTLVSGDKAGIIKVHRDLKNIHSSLVIE